MGEQQVQSFNDPLTDAVYKWAGFAQYSDDGQIRIARQNAIRERMGKLSFDYDSTRQSMDTVRKAFEQLQFDHRMQAAILETGHFTDIGLFTAHAIHLQDDHRNTYHRAKAAMNEDVKAIERVLNSILDDIHPIQEPAKAPDEEKAYLFVNAEDYPRAAGLIKTTILSRLLAEHPMHPVDTVELNELAHVEGFRLEKEGRVMVAISSDSPYLHNGWNERTTLKIAKIPHFLAERTNISEAGDRNKNFARVNALDVPTHGGPAWERTK